VAGQEADKPLVLARQAMDVEETVVTRSPAAIESEAITANAISIPDR